MVIWIRHIVRAENGHHSTPMNHGLHGPSTYKSSVRPDLCSADSRSVIRGIVRMIDSLSRSSLLGCYITTACKSPSSRTCLSARAQVIGNTSDRI